LFANIVNAGYAAIMPRRLIASLLFCFALLMQVLSPVASGVAMEFAEGDSATPGVLLCRLIHDGGAVTKSSLVGSKRSEQAPAPGGAHHDHHSCSLCQIGSNAAFYDSNVAPVAGPVITWLRLDRLGRAEHAVDFHFIRSAFARAPPSFA
jgi:hypothetical protein